MLKAVKSLISCQEGQAMSVALILLAMGGLMVTPLLNYAGTSLNSIRAINKYVRGVYAADAGVEYALWCLANSQPAPTQLPENTNGMNVTMQTQDMGTYTAYFGELVQAGEHSNYLSVSGEMAWDDGVQAYKYTITVTWQPQSGAPTIHLEKIGARLPVGYSYQTGSAASFANNPSLDEPAMSQDAFGAQMVNWEFVTPLPDVSQSDPVKTQTFYTIGEGNNEDHCAWIVASRNDIGSVSEITGNLYIITATAKDVVSSETTAIIIADIMLTADSTYVTSWRISK